MIQPDCTQDTDHLWAAYERLRDQTERLGAALYARLNLPVSEWQDDIDEWQRHQDMALAAFEAWLAARNAAQHNNATVQ